MHTRIKIAHEFHIEKKGQTHVDNNMIRSDGYNFVDIELALTADNIAKYLQTDEKSMSTLWRMLIDKAEGRVNNVVPETVVVVTPGLVVAPPTPPEKIEVVPLVNKTKPRGRPKQKKEQV